MGATLGEATEPSGASAEYAGVSELGSGSFNWESRHLGDCNEVEITLLGTVAKPSPKEFATEGPDVVEDSAGVGGIAGIVAIAKQGKGKEYKQVSEWLRRAFKKHIDDVLDYPSVRDIYTRVFGLVKTASTANPKAVSNCWQDYIVVR